LLIKGLKNDGKKYQIQVRSYKAVDGVKYYSKWSKTKTSSELPQLVKGKKYKGHWLEVDISRQKAWLRDGDMRVQSFVVSTGKKATPSDIGTFKVWAKRSIQHIRGRGYSYPKTKWLTYYNGGEAFHTAYWHDNFGTPMSHGCVNMKEAEAKIVYNWAKVGTVVVVHK
jgi:lipoprotein-anchoring transpeptidase ErfK/SrfK